ncbi:MULTISPECIES: ABC transporter permease [unclassified Brevundimonas]|uniref:ABC transporter permease n=1 Tax=unclassified Brevundimonas TaxID=2622653 RepID=UPI0025C38ACA|nr:ABC transporter permease [Brevundimonas sp. UBA5866]
MQQVQSQGEVIRKRRRSPLYSLYRSTIELGRTLYALIMREMMTRYGREGIGFFWLIAEPLAFCLAVIALWSAIKPDYEFGIRVAPFTMSGYMCLLVIRHLVTHSLHALQANTGLLFHRKVRPLHIYISRAILEVLGSTLAFFIVYVLLLALGQVDLPKDWLLLYAGWFILAWVSFGFALVLAALSIRFDAVERLNNLLLYIMIPLSGAFVMAEYVPVSYREYFLYIPFPHAIEMVRAGIWGEFIKTHYTPWYPIAFGGVLILIGLAMLNMFSNHIETE